MEQATFYTFLLAKFSTFKAVFKLFVYTFSDSIENAALTTDPLLENGLAQPIRDQFKDVGHLTPSADAVQQLAKLSWSRS